MLPTANQPSLEETTLDEPVIVTLKREFNAIANKMYKVMLPGSDSKSELRNWDLWGPLFICLFLAILLSTGASSAPVTKGKGAEDQSAGVFASVFVIVWCGAAVVTLNAVLLGGTVSFFQSICVLGYCLFPMTLAAIISMGIGWSHCGSGGCTAVRMALVLGGLAWSTRASLGFLSEIVSSKRGVLAAYPVCLFYASLAWIIVVRSSPA
mmetsp:Transcript_51291/g.133946  ORF Transcript_51291/g.133946 Transcript_51291/m.133946 type:complete len:209 (-) Transcript_51291:77-703(-)